jgi:hypothetical protein
MSRSKYVCPGSSESDEGEEGGRVGGVLQARAKHGEGVTAIDLRAVGASFGETTSAGLFVVQV